MANRIRLSEGEYEAVSRVAVFLMSGNQEKEYTEYKPGERFTVPRHVNQFWSAAVYYPDFGDKEPEFRKVN